MRVSVEDLEGELERTKKSKRYRRTVRGTLIAMVVVAAFAVLVATLWMPVLRIYGSSMTPTLEEGNIVISLKGGKIKTGELISFYYGNRLLVKRVIAGSGDWVEIDHDTGDVSLNGGVLKEPYISEKAYGDVSIEFPYQVPEKRYFVMGDHRATSADSRNKAIGCISEEQVVGKIVFRIWPLSKFGKI